MSKAKAKGTGYENEVTHYLNEQIFIEAERCGLIVGHPGDVKFSVYPGSNLAHRGPYYIECKRRAGAWKQLYSWLNKNVNDFLFLRADYEESLVVMRASQFRQLVTGGLPALRRRECSDKS